MNLKLEKKEDRYDLYDESTGQKIASDLMQGNGVKLSTNNCEAVFNGYDLDELAKYFSYNQSNEDSQEDFAEFSYKEGFKKALEIREDKKFTLGELLSFADHVKGYNESTYSRHSQEILEEWLSENSVNKLKVEIVTEESEQAGGNVWHKPKLDANGCIILRRKK